MKRGQREDADQACPKDWIEAVNIRCDLDLAFEALEGYDHFHTDTLRGRLRTFQLWPEEALEFFLRAEARAEESACTPLDLLRRFYLRVYCFENALLEESVPGGGDPAVTEKYLKRAITDEAPCGKAGECLQHAHAVFLLHRQDYERAEKRFLRLLEWSQGQVSDHRTDFFLGAAVAHRGLGEVAEADRQLENACLAIPTLENTFQMGIFAASASSLLRVWGREGEAQEWDGFITRRKVPEKTRALFQERSRRMVERSTALGWVFLF